MALAVTLSDMKEHLRVDITDEDDLITMYIEAATTYIEEATKRRFINATETKVQEEFYTPQRLAYSPLSSVTSITYYDTDNAQQMLSTDVYGVVTGDAGFIYLKYNQTWPDLYDRPDAITISYISGYGAAATTTPKWANQLIKLLCENWYTHRGLVTEHNSRSAVTEISPTIITQIEMYKIQEVAY